MNPKNQERIYHLLAKIDIPPKVEKQYNQHMPVFYLEVLMLKAILCLCVVTCPLTAELLLEPRLQPIRVTTSVIVPCAASHFEHIPELLVYYKHQTLPPNEIIISLSECERVPTMNIEAVENASWNFQLRIVKNKGKCSAGENRNIAFENSVGDLILTQDADDLPHPQRVEILKYLFENYQIERLLHLWIPQQKPFEEYQVQELQARYYNAYPPWDLIPFHNACVCVLRSICEKIQWPVHFLRTEDTEFNLSVYADPSIKHKVMLFANFIKYRINFSTAPVSET